MNKQMSNIKRDQQYFMICILTCELAPRALNAKAKAKAITYDVKQPAAIAIGGILQLWLGSSWRLP